MLRYIILVTYIILLFASYSVVSLLRYNKINEIAMHKKHKLLNHRYILRILLSVLNLLLLVGSIGIIFTESSILFLIVDILIVFIVQFLLVALTQIYTLNITFIYNYDKLFLYFKSEAVSFDLETISFEHKNNYTILYYQDDVVVKTKQKINTKVIENSL